MERESNCKDEVNVRVHKRVRPPAPLAEFIRLAPGPPRKVSFALSSFTFPASLRSDNDSLPQTKLRQRCWLRRTLSGRWNESLLRAEARNRGKARSARPRPGGRLSLAVGREQGLFFVFSLLEGFRGRAFRREISLAIAFPSEKFPAPVPLRALFRRAACPLPLGRTPPQGTFPRKKLPLEPTPPREAFPRQALPRHILPSRLAQMLHDQAHLAGSKPFVFAGIARRFQRLHQGLVHPDPPPQLRGGRLGGAEREIHPAQFL